MANKLPPVAPAKPHVVIMPNGTERNDPYHWLRDDNGKDREVLKYLHDENDYAKEIIKQNRKLERRLFDDMAGRVPRVETSTPTPSGSLSYWYGSSRSSGQGYWVHNRRPAMSRVTPGGGPAVGGGAQLNPLSYGPDLKAAAEVVLDINKLAKKFTYCDVVAVKPSPDGKYVAFTVDTVGKELYEVIVQEIATGRRVATEGSVTANPKTAPLGGIPGCGPSIEWSADSSSVFVLLLTSGTQEAYKLVRARLLPKFAGRKTPDPELLLHDKKAGALLEMAGLTACGRFLMISRRSQGYTTLLALTLKPGSGSRPGPAPRPKGVPKDVVLYGNDPWIVVAPESEAVDVLRAEHLYGNGKTETFVVMLDSDRYPDGHVAIVTDGDIKGRTVLIPGQRGHQVVDIAVVGRCDGGGGSGTTSAARGPYLAVHVLEDMVASVEIYDATALRQALESGRTIPPGRRRRQAAAVTVSAAAAATGTGEVVADRTAAAEGSSAVDADAEANAEAEGEPDQDSIDDVCSSKGGVSDGGDEKGQGDEGVSGDQGDGDGERSKAGDAEEAHCLLRGVEEGQQARRALADTGLPLPLPLPLMWTYKAGPTISSMHLDQGCWPGNVPYLRLSYSSMTTPLTTVDLDLPSNKSYVRSVEEVVGFAPESYRSETVYATAPDGTRVPATVAGRADAWPLRPGGKPLPCILQLYGAYGRKLLPSFIPADLAIMDGAGSSDADAGPGPTLMVLAHVRGGGELGSAWHVQGKLHRKWNTADDFAAVVRTLVDEGYCDPRALAVWGRSAGGLATGMVLHRCPAGTFRAAILDVPFVDVLGSMMDPDLPLTIKERPEWGDPLNSQEDYDYILSYTPYEHVEPVARQTPAMMVTCSLNDPRVPYWGPAKYVARLRAAMAADAAADGGPVMLLTEMNSGGHFSVSNASGKLAERAARGAFMLGEFRKAVGVPAAAMDGGDAGGAGGALKTAGP